MYVALPMTLVIAGLPANTSPELPLYNPCHSLTGSFYFLSLTKFGGAAQLGPGLGLGWAMRKIRHLSSRAAVAQFFGRRREGHE